MFLNFLNSEEKNTFLKLAISVIQADGKLEESEKSYISDYSREMGITEFDLNEKIDPLPLAEKIGVNSTDFVKRVFLLELLACAKAEKILPAVPRVDFIPRPTTAIKAKSPSNSMLSGCARR